jgi:hypothetical protein
MLKAACFVFALAFLGVVCSAITVEAAIPQKGSVAVLVKGPSEQHAASTESIITGQLLMNGYKIVDPKVLNRIRRDKAAVLALEGNVDAIMKLGRTYGFSTLVSARVEAGAPVLNEFKLYTGTASAAVMATASNGSRLYADTVSGKQVGYTPDEARQKSIEAAAKLAVERMTK